MSRIAFVGDPHIQWSNPTSRIDNYFEAVIKKLIQVLEYNDVVVCLGDMFSHPVLDIQGTMIIIELLRNFKERGGEFYTLIGNHDIYNWQIKTLEKTTLGLLAKLHLIDILDSSNEIPYSKPWLRFDSWYIQPTNLNNPKPLPEARGENSILVGHNYYAFARDNKHSLEFEDFKEKGFKYIFLGHDHENYQPKVIENGVLYRPGSLGREAAHKYNMTRQIIYYQLNTATGKVRPINIDQAPANEVFSLEVIERHEDNTPKYVYDMEELMNSFKKKSSVAISIKKLMEDNDEIPDKVIDYIESCYEACGLAFV